MLTVRGAASTGFVQALRDRSHRAFEMVERRLESSEYFAAGRFTAADIIMAQPVPKNLVIYLIMFNLTN
jgi:glutathione S-transferase